MTKAELSALIQRVFTDEIQPLFSAGNDEYAHSADNAFANFDRVAKRMGLTREHVLLVYVEKHMDGIHSWANGHKSQREDVRGRINDEVVYLLILRGMIDDAEAREREAMAERGAAPCKTCDALGACGCGALAAFSEGRPIACPKPPPVQPGDAYREPAPAPPKLADIYRSLPGQEAGP